MYDDINWDIIGESFALDNDKIDFVVDSSKQTMTNSGQCSNEYIYGLLEEFGEMNLRLPIRFDIVTVLSKMFFSSIMLGGILVMSGVA